MQNFNKNIARKYLKVADSLVSKSENSAFVHKLNQSRQKILSYLSSNNSNDRMSKIAKQGTSEILEFLKKKGQ